MMTIWKYQFVVDDVVSLTMPEDAQILSVECQSSTPTMWALVDSNAPAVARTFRIVGPGHPIPDAARLKHIATFQQPPFVWHVFEPTR